MKAYYLILVVLLVTGLTLGCLGAKKEITSGNETNVTAENQTTENNTTPAEHENTPATPHTTVTEHKTTIDKSSINITDINETIWTNDIYAPNMTDDDVDMGELI
jgi:hypothetical protein